MRSSPRELTCGGALQATRTRACGVLQVIEVGCGVLAGEIRLPSADRPQRVKSCAAASRVRVLREGLRQRSLSRRGDGRIPIDSSPVNVKYVGLQLLCLAALAGSTTSALETLLERGRDS